MIFIKINNKIFYVKKNISILEACKFVGITIPRFCYHENLSIAGNCRMCLVEIEPNVNLKPVSACTLIISEDSNILTETPFVKKARENVLETLLLNHPLDCPICDQAGECDLQDQTLLYGLKNSRYTFKKRNVEDKNLGSFIKTIMTRCIHCTRCVRFSDEIIGTKILGTLNRGQNTEIGTYVNLGLNSNISGNIIDLCPVGALTSKVYAFKARPWELKINETIDLTDSFGSTIYVSVKEAEIVRIMPKKTEDSTSSFISDKTRFSFDSVKHLRLLNIYIKKNSWEKINWQLLLNFFSNKFLTKFNLFIIPEDLDYQNIQKLLHLQKISNLKVIVTSLNKSLNSNFYANKLFFNTNIVNNNTKFCFLLSSNLKIESILLNIKIRNKFLSSSLEIYSSGFNSSSNFFNSFVTFNVTSLIKIFEAKHFFSKKIILNSFPLFILGSSINNYIFKTNFNFFLKKIVPTASILFLNSSSNSEANSFFNIKALNSNLFKKSSNVFTISLNDNLLLNKFLFNSFNKCVFWFNSHSPTTLKKKNFLIPTLTFFEFDGIFINSFGKAQKAYKSLVNSNKDVISLDFLSNFFIELYSKNNKVLPFISVFYFFIEMSNQFIIIDNNILNSPTVSTLYSNFFNKSIHKPLIEDFYQTNLFTKNSLNMFKRSKEIRTGSTNFFRN